MTRILRVVCTAMLLAGLAVTTARAQDSLLRELYGQGVHAYFSSDYQRAHELLTMAIDQGTTDPRCYYFRGLAYNKLGRPDEATADFEQGAKLEAAGAAIQVDVGRSLQRVQGETRLELEQTRYTAKLAARIKDVQQKQERYEDHQRNEPRVLRQPGGEMPETVDLPATTSSDPNDPFGGGSTPPAPAPGPAPPDPGTLPPPPPPTPTTPGGGPA